jgi:ubiquinone/menaquinone biosynthesis C-methylase UbiE
MDQRAQIAGIFDRAASTYDRVGVELFGPVADELVSTLAPQAGERALDIGCGRGAMLLRLAAAVGPTGTAAGIDLAPQMVAAAQTDAATAGLTVDVSVGDAQEPDFPAKSFDVVASSLVLFFLPDPAAALAAWRRLLVPGGRLGVSTFGPLPPAWQEVDAVFEPYLPPQLRDARTTGARGPFGSDAGVEQLLTQAGFQDVRTRTTTVAVRFDDADHWHRWTWSVGQRAMWEHVPAGDRDAVRAAAGERLERCRDDGGRIGFDQQVRHTYGRC